MSGYPLFVNGDILESDNDAIRYLSKRLSVHRLTLQKMFKDGVVFKGNTPYQMAYNFELASILFRENQASTKKSISNKKEKTSIARPLFQVDVTIGKETHTFSTKRQILEYLGRRYGTKPNNMARRLNELCIFWTTDALDIVQDITRADAYTRAYLTHAVLHNKEDYIVRRNVMKNEIKKGKADMPALDGQMHMESSISSKNKEEVPEVVDIGKTKEDIAFEEMQLDLESLPVMKQDPVPEPEAPYIPGNDKATRTAVKAMSKTIGVTTETIRRQYRRRVFDKPASYYAEHPDVLIAEYKAYQERIDIERKQNMQVIHDRQRRGEIMFHHQTVDGVLRNHPRKKKKTIDASIAEIDKLITALEKSHINNIGQIHKLKDKTVELEQANLQIEQDILKHREQRKVLEDAQRVIESFQ